MLGKLDTHIQKGSCLTHTMHKIISKWISDLSVRSGTKTPTKKTWGKSSMMLIWAVSFLDMTMKAQGTKSKVDKLN